MQMEEHATVTLKHVLTALSFSTSFNIVWPQRLLQLLLLQNQSRTSPSRRDRRLMGIHHREQPKGTSCGFLASCWLWDALRRLPKDTVCVLTTISNVASCPPKIRDAARVCTFVQSKDVRRCTWRWIARIRAVRLGSDYAKSPRRNAQMLTLSLVVRPMQSLRLGSSLLRRPSCQM